VQSRFDPVQKHFIRFACCLQLSDRFFFWRRIQTYRGGASDTCGHCRLGARAREGFFGRAAGESGSHVGRDRGTTRAARKGLRCEIPPGRQIVLSDLEKMLVEQHPDAVLVYTTIADHRKVIETAARHGVSSMLEKPLATTLEDALAIRAIAHGTAGHSASEVVNSAAHAQRPPPGVLG
jgi:Oxidoreductase family, NAD-binding Rossmann fold